jgi:hypothetical protein
MTHLINDEAVYRTAPATPGLLKINLKTDSLKIPFFNQKVKKKKLQKMLSL